jgi:hypothetical protein
MSLNYQNVDFVKVPDSYKLQSLSKIDTRRNRKMPEYVKISRDLHSEEQTEFDG